MNAYRAQKWQEAEGTFGVLLTFYPDDGPERIFLQRKLDFIKKAPATDWDGAYVMKTK